eukprot:4700990-Prymnesium_polylepis.1
MSASSISRSPAATSRSRICGGSSGVGSAGELPSLWTVAAGPAGRAGFAIAFAAFSVAHGRHRG